jgi:predicted enzyme related to lactoylglutathione lyase
VKIAGVISVLALGTLAPTASASPEPEGLIGTKIVVSDLQRSVDFYEKVVGLQPMSAGADSAAVASTLPFIEIPLNQSASRRDPQLYLIRKKGVIPAPESAALTMLVFHVSDVAAVMARVKAGGYKVRFDTTVSKAATFGIAFDPDGYQVEFLQVKAQ